MKLLNNTHIRFLLFSLLVALLIGILGFTLPQLIHEKVWNSYLFLVVLSFGVGLLNAFLLKAFAENFFQIMVLAMILRFVGTLVFIGVSVWPGMENIILFIANFFVIFLFYLVFDIYVFLSNLRPISK